MNPFIVTMTDIEYACSMYREEKDTTECIDNILNTLPCEDSKREYMKNMFHFIEETIDEYSSGKFTEVILSCLSNSEMKTVLMEVIKQEKLSLLFNDLINMEKEAETGLKLTTQQAAAWVFGKFI